MAVSAASTEVFEIATWSRNPCATLAMRSASTSTEMLLLPLPFSDTGDVAIMSVLRRSMTGYYHSLSVLYRSL
jgi:hypothetical protein